MAILQMQTRSKDWREVGRCADNDQIIGRRLDDYAKQYDRVRAVDDRGRVLDIR